MRADGNTERYDAIVVGARCAGSPLAMLLARGGHRVLVVDRSTFPSDTISTHFIQISGVGRLARWGLLDELRRTDCPAIEIGVLDFGGEPLEAETHSGTSLPGSFAPRRTVLDKILVDGARAAGAEVREGTFVDKLIRDGDRVIGVHAHDEGGESFSATARVVVGADGRNSIVAREVDAETYVSHPSVSWGYYGYWSGVECTRAEIFLRPRRFSVAFPTNHGLTLVAVGFPMEEFQAVRQDSEKRFLDALDDMGTLGERVRAGTREERLVGLRENPNFMRTPFGPGWALVGDAGYHKDPTPAQGISDAFRDAELLAGALDEVLTGATPEHEALTRYHAARDDRAKPMLDATMRMSSFDVPPPERGQAFIELLMLQVDDLAPTGDPI